ncbi:glycosyltransferase [Vibrio lamellibrachiae]|uniref:glycosyltransferase n=1 Tax=Vibrio lamellibrachiae TaxID=2910253 RepID=UPI003D100048
MKILLVGDFSGFHLALSEGLKELGHQVMLVSSGDGWKNIDSDLSINSRSTSVLVNKLERNLKPFLNLNKMSGYDIVQFVNVKPLSCSLFTNYILAKFLKKINGKLVLSACGSDSYYWTSGREHLEYSPHKDVLKYDEGNGYWLDKRAIDINNKMVSLSDGIIPVMFEYEHAYRNEKKLLPVIPLPVNLTRIKYLPNVAREKIKFYHGINRIGFKGTKYIEQAFKRLGLDYSDRASFNIKGRMPYNEYLNYIKSVNVIVDQTSSYSCGMNGLLSMASGKVVFSGAEKESLKSLGISESPIVNIRPCEEYIYSITSDFINSNPNIEERGYQSRDFVEKNHSHIDIAEKYVRQWLGLL